MGRELQPTNQDGQDVDDPITINGLVIYPNGKITDAETGETILTRDGSDVNVHTGGSVKNISNVQEEIQQIVDHPDRPPIARLDDTESIEIPIRVPDKSTLEVYRWGAFDASDGSAPAGLTAELLDGSDTVQASENTANNQSMSSTVASNQNTSGSASIFKLRAKNGTGSAINNPGVGCVFGYRVV